MRAMVLYGALDDRPCTLQRDLIFRQPPSDLRGQEVMRQFDPTQTLMTSPADDARRDEFLYKRCSLTGIAAESTGDARHKLGFPEDATLTRIRNQRGENPASGSQVFSAESPQDPLQVSRENSRRGSQRFVKLEGQSAVPRASVVQVVTHYLKLRR